MNKDKGKTLWAVLALAIAVWTVASCEMDGGKEDDESQYSEATAAVDYSGTDPGKAVFIDFSSNRVTRELPHDFFDIAIFSTGAGPNSTVHIIANSGSYGTGVRVLKTDSTNLDEDFSASAGSITQYTFKEGKTIPKGYQGEENPLAGASGSATKNVFLVKVQYGSAGPEYFKVVFDRYGPQGQYKITVVPGLAAGSEKKAELTGGLSGINDEGGYGYIFFDLHGEGGPRALNDGADLKEGVMVNIPKAAEWDLLCTRTDDIVDTIRQRSSILLNQVKGVAAATVSGKYLEDVLDTSELSFSDDIDAIGFSWYWTDNRGNYATENPDTKKPVATFVVKTAEGNYAKFQPGSFYGPNGKNGPEFHMVFRYYYVANATGGFDK
jgi:hypothetical protein